MQRAPADALKPVSMMFGKQIIDFVSQKEWNIPAKIVVSLAASGGFINPDQNPNHPCLPAEITHQCAKCVDMGVVEVHVHGRDSEGHHSTDPKDFKAIVEPLRKKYGRTILLNSGVSDRIVLGGTMDDALSFVEERLIDVGIVNPTSGRLGNLARINPPSTMQTVAEFYEKNGIKPMVDIHDTGCIANTKAYLIDTGILKKPFAFHLIIGHPGTMYAPNVKAMVQSLQYMVERIQELDDKAFITVSNTSRSTIYILTLAILLGLHVRTGMEDTIWRYPHRNDLIKDNMEYTRATIQIAKELGRDLATAEDYRRMMGMPAA